MKKNPKIAAFLEEDYLKTSSAQDCTGLIPKAVADDAELESYEDLYPFLPKIIRPEDSSRPD